MKYIIYTGYVKDVTPSNYAGRNAQDFFNIWYSNTRKYTNAPIHIFGPHIPVLDNTENIKSIAEYQNLGHVGQYINGTKQGIWCGWTAGVVYGMVDAYIRNVDFIYKEQDCLAFGNYIDKMYSEIEDGGIIMGNYSLLPCAQSLFLVKRNYIPEVIKFLANDEDRHVLPEDKFNKIPNQKRLSFGYDRDRPFYVEDEIFYIQQISMADMDTLVNTKLITL